MPESRFGAYIAYDDRCLLKRVKLFDPMLSSEILSLDPKSRLVESELPSNFSCLQANLFELVFPFCFFRTPSGLPTKRDGRGGSPEAPTKRELALAPPYRFQQEVKQREQSTDCS